jgi:catechol 2,3-dioxygenase-like lactoylglutathione lyase family enzyme
LFSNGKLKNPHLLHIELLNLWYIILKGNFFCINRRRNGMSQGLHHIGLSTNNPDRLLLFYKEKLGFTPESTKTVGRELMERIFGILSDCTVTKLRRQNVLIEIFSSGEIRFAEEGGQHRGLNHWSLCVEDKKSFATDKDRDFVFTLAANASQIHLIPTRYHAEIRLPNSKR